MKKILFIMDPIPAINIKKDSTFAVMLAAQKAGHKIYYSEGKDLFLRDGEVFATPCPIWVNDDSPQHFQFLGHADKISLKNIDIIFMRLDPPVTLHYLYLTHLLELAMKHGTKIINHPASLRDCNEKLFAQWFPECCPPTLVTQNMTQIKNFLSEQKRIIIKPLDGMGGRGIFYLDEQDKNRNAILESATQCGKTLIMAQRFLPEIAQGDKRITLIHGQPLDYAVARIPVHDEIRGNLAAGGAAKILPLTARDRWLCTQITPTLQAKNLLWVGVDVIGDYITEINVTSPTCLREVEAYTQTLLIDDIMQRLIF